jgi:hypothetical protein
MSKTIEESKIYGILNEHLNDQIIRYEELKFKFKNRLLFEHYL